MSKYFREWKLKTNPDKSEVAGFHLNNSIANTAIKADLEEKRLKNSMYTKYLGVMLDCSFADS